MEKPQRKHTRLKYYDYSLPEYYYVTIHVCDSTVQLSKVGQGLAPAEPVLQLTRLGRIAQCQLLALEQRYSHVKIDKYGVMPTHIHAIIQMVGESEGKQHPTLMDVVGAFKSLTTRQANQIFGTPGKKLFQASFYEEVLRSERAYQACWRYIDENPLKWFLNPEDR